IPITCPAESNNGPPELPGLIAASTWIALVIVASERSDSSLAITGRSRAEMIPVVTVESSPSGLPTAMTGSPTSRLSELPSVPGVRLSGASLICTTARSVVGSAPTTSAWYNRPSTIMICSFSAPAMTWLFVRIRPSSSMTTPEPAPAPFAPVTWIATTAGRTSSAMFAQSGVPATAGADAGWELTAGDGVGEDVDRRTGTAVPTEARPAPSGPAANPAGQTRRCRGRRGCTGTGGANGVGLNAAGLNAAGPSLGPVCGAPHPHEEDSGAPGV